jgi:ubiquinone/menaquinone biosynthesis C-methylase UbiE
MIYDRFAKGYDRAFAPLEKRFLARWRKEALSRLPDRAVILEVGAGTGANFAFYPPAECAVASEISLKMLELARPKTTSVELVQASAEILPFAENTFDAAFATLVFCSIPRPEKAFAELRRVIKPGGRVVLLEHVRPENPAGFFFDALNLLTVALIEDHFNRRTARLAVEAGFRLVELERKALGVVNLIVCENAK